MFVPVQDRIDKLIPDPIEVDTFNYLSSIAEKFIINGH